MSKPTAAVTHLEGHTFWRIHNPSAGFLRRPDVSFNIFFHTHPFDIGGLNGTILGYGIDEDDIGIAIRSNLLVIALSKALGGNRWTHVVDCRFDRC